MKKLTQAQIDLFSVVEKSIPKLVTLQSEASRVNCPILERELIHIQRQLRDALEMQARAFRDDSLSDPEPLFPQGMFPYGKRNFTESPTGTFSGYYDNYWCATCGGYRKYTHECQPSNQRSFVSGKDRSAGERE